MNKRLEVLVAQATVKMPGYGVFGESDDRAVFNPTLLAQLIVQDCVEMCEDERNKFLELAAQNNGRESDFAFGSVNSAERIADAIRNRFEVNNERQD